MTPPLSFFFFPLFFSSFFGGPDEYWPYHELCVLDSLVTSKSLHSGEAAGRRRAAGLRRHLIGRMLTSIVGAANGLPRKLSPLQPQPEKIQLVLEALGTSNAPLKLPRPITKTLPLIFLLVPSNTTHLVPRNTLACRPPLHLAQPNWSRGKEKRRKKEW